MCNIKILFKHNKNAVFKIMTVAVQNIFVALKALTVHELASGKVYIEETWHPQKHPLFDSGINKLSEF